jgi:signal recognition particle GTPase
MKNIRQIFKGNEHLTGFGPVEELIEYCQELEGQVLERKVEDVYDKEHMLKSMLQDILTSCRDMEETNQLAERYPGMYEKSDAESLVKNLKTYILDMNYKNKLGI